MSLKNIILAFVLTLSMATTAQVNPNYQVEIVRDSFGVPHIFGKTDADCSYGLVYCALEDDYKTVMWGLLLARGKLGLMMGIEGAKIDYAVQLLGVPEFLEKHYEADLSPEAKKLLVAGAAAGNDWIAKNPDKIIFKNLLPIRPTDFIAGYMLSMALMTGVDGAIKSVVGETMPTIEYNRDARGSNALAMNVACINGPGYCPSGVARISATPVSLTPNSTILPLRLAGRNCGAKSSENEIVSKRASG